jgi:hypothetical protein
MPLCECVRFAGVLGWFAHLRSQLLTLVMLVVVIQRTWAGNTKRQKSMHEENGFFRFVGSNKVELLVTQCTGVQEVLAGTWTKDDASEKIKISVETTGLTRTPSASPPHVTRVRREYTFDLDGESLEYQIFMATDKTPELTLHLSGKHTRLLPAYIADDGESEEEELDNQLLEPEPTRHAHTHSRGHSRQPSA